MLLWLWILIAVLIGGSVGIMMGEARSLNYATIGGVTGMIYAYYVETKLNFDKYILTPAWEVIMGERTPGIFEVGAIFLIIAMGVVAIIAFYNAVATWTKDKPFALWR